MRGIHILLRLAFLVLASSLYGQFTPPSGSSGTVTSVTIQGTANQVSVSACSGSVTVNCTISLPSVLTLPGTLNKITITSPATGSTFTPADGSTLQTTGAFTINLTATANATPTFVSGASVVARTDAGQTFNGTQVFQAITATNVTNSALTSGRIVYSGTGGLATDSANLAYSGTALTVGSTVNVGVSGAQGQIAVLNGTPAVRSFMGFTPSGSIPGFHGGAISVLTFSSGNDPTAGNQDVGLSRKTSTAGWLKAGNGTANDASGTLEAATLQANTGLILSAVSSGVTYKAGSNARTGTGTLSGGTLAVANTSVTANSQTFVQDTGGGVLANIGALYVTQTPGTGFTVTSSNALDTSTFRYWIFETN